MSKRVQFLLTALLVAVLMMSACGGGAKEEAAPAQEAAPLAAVEEEAAPTEAPAEEAAPEEEVAPTEEPAEEAAAEEPATEEEVAGEEDAVVAAIDEYLSSIPEGWMATGKVEDIQALVDGGETVFIDVREPSEYAEGHIPGAVNVPLRTLAQNLDKVPTDQNVIVYCASGHRAGMGTSALRALGYDNVKSFPGSWKAWAAADGEVDMEANTGETYETPEIDPDLAAAVDGFLSTIPEGWLSVKTVEDVQAAVDNGAFLVDVREPEEYAEGHILDAINVPLRTLAQNLDQIPTDQPVIVYCGSGHRAALATTALQSMGYENVKSFPGSWAAWKAAMADGDVAAPEEAATEEVAAEEEVPAEIEAAMDSDFDAVAIVGAYLSAIPEGWMSTGNAEAMTEMLENAAPYLIDVRTPAEYAEGHIPGAVNIPLRTLADNLDQIPSDENVVVYCASGHRAGMATSTLRSLGYENVKAFPGGWKAWSEAENVVETEANEPGTFEVGDVNPEMVAAAAEFLNNIPEGFYAVGDIEKFKGAMDAGATVIDVRQPDEYAAGHIPGAINIPLRELADNTDQIPTDEPVFVYCQSGWRAALATGALHNMGYENVRSFPPSFGGWEAAGEEIEK